MFQTSHILALSNSRFVTHQLLSAFDRGGGQERRHSFWRASGLPSLG